MEAERECQCCDGSGRVLRFHCKGVCECGRCPDVDDCPVCVGQITMDEPLSMTNILLRDLNEAVVAAKAALVK
jgi:hypothetical protein